MEREFGSGKIRLVGPCRVQGDPGEPGEVSVVATFLRKEKGAPGLVRFVLFDAETFRTYREVLGSL